MNIISATALLLGAGLLIASSARADEIEYTCSGRYRSAQKYDAYDPRTVSVDAHLSATMLGDPQADGSFFMEKVTLKLTAANDGDKDAGSFVIKKEFTGKPDRTNNPKYKDYLKFELGSKVAPAYADDGDAPTTYLLIPQSGRGDVYIQRQGSGHDVYPTITLTCQP